MALVPPPARAQASGEGLRPGDVVRITVFRKPELSGEMEVAPDGTLLHPLYRAVPASGLAPDALEQQLGAFLRRYEAEPSFVVETLHRVTVGGEVRAPATYTVRPGTTVFEALSQAGGINPQGRTDQVRLLREGTVTVVRAGETGAGGGTLPLHSGDVLMVDRRVNVFREYVQPIATVIAAAAAVVNLFIGK